MTAVDQSVAALRIRVWHWVPARGREAMARLDEDLDRLAQGERPVPETLAAEIAALPLMVGADGVKVPLRPHGGDPRGAVVWHEVKVGVLARFCHRVHESGEHAFVLKQRRVVAVLGDIEVLKPHLGLEALRQCIEQAPRVVWLSDGGGSLWRGCCQVKAKCMEPTTTRWVSIPIETPHLVVKIGRFSLT